VKFNSYSCILSLVIIVVTTRTQAQLSAPGSANDGRPSSVPTNYLPTPFGWSHPSCVIEVGEDQKIDLDGNIALRSDGTVVRKLTHCQHLQYDVRGNVISAAHPPSPTVNGWLVDGSTYTGQLAFLSANWVVPANPTNISGQVLYFFPALLPEPSNDEVLQPVLAWNQNGPGWTIASWRYSTSMQNNHHSALVAVNPGDQLYGYVWGTNCNTSTRVCSTWQVLTSNGTYQTTLQSDSMGEVLNWSVGGAYEAYNVNTCDQHSPTQTMTFSNLYARTIDGVVLTPTWVEDYWSPSPACSVAFVSPTSSTATITWCIPLTRIPGGACSGKCGQNVSDGCGGLIACPRQAHCAPKFTWDDYYCECVLN